MNELEEMVAIFLASGYSEDKFSFDPSVVRGLGYYTGPVFEVELNKKIIDKKGNEHSFGSISGGGRYDDLVKRFTGQNVPATGVSIGVDRLIAALKIEEKIKQNKLSWIKEQRETIEQFKKQKAPEFYQQFRPDGYSVDKEKWDIDKSFILEQAEEALDYLKKMEDSLK